MTARPSALLLATVAAIGLIGSTLAMPMTNAAFSGQTANAGSSIAAAAKFYPPGLDHHWPLEGNATDGVGSADGTITGTTNIAGRVENALEFDEVDDVIQLPVLAYTADFTLALDFKLDDNTGALVKYAFSQDDADGFDSINIFITESSHGTSPDMLRTVARDNDDTLDILELQVDVSSLVGDGLWHTYALVVDSTTGLTVYVDGLPAAFDPTRGTDGIVPIGAAYLGADDDLGMDRFFGGGLDTLQIYDRALTPAEIADHAA